jgi:hypothetical protein
MLMARRQARGRDYSPSPNALSIASHPMSEISCTANKGTVSRGNSCPFRHHVAQHVQAVACYSGEIYSWVARRAKRMAGTLRSPGDCNIKGNECHCPVQSGNIMQLRRLPSLRRYPRGLQRLWTVLRKLWRGSLRYQTSPLNIDRRAASGSGYH